MSYPPLLFTRRNRPAVAHLKQVLAQRGIFEVEMETRCVMGKARNLLSRGISICTWIGPARRYEVWEGYRHIFAVALVWLEVGTLALQVWYFLWAVVAQPPMREEARFFRINRLAAAGLHHILVAHLIDVVGAPLQDWWCNIFCPTSWRLRCTHSLCSWFAWLRGILTPWVSVVCISLWHYVKRPWKGWITGCFSEIVMPYPAGASEDYCITCWLTYQGFNVSSVNW